MHSRPAIIATLLCVVGVTATLARGREAAQRSSLAQGIVTSTSQGPIDWTAAQKAEQATSTQPISRFVAANRKAIDVVRLPVILPTDADLTPNLRLFPKNEFYTLSSKNKMVAVMITGSRKAFELPSSAARRLPRGSLQGRLPTDGIVVERTESGIDASFSRFGVAYSISVECADASNDSYCANEAYIRGLIDKAAVVVPQGMR